MQKRKTEHRSLDLLLSKPKQSKAFLRTLYSESCFSPKLLYRLVNRPPMTSQDRPSNTCQNLGQVDALRQRDCSAHRDQCRVHSLWTKHPSFCSFQRACFVTIFQLRRVDKFSLAAAGRPQAASTTDKTIPFCGLSCAGALISCIHPVVGFSPCDWHNQTTYVCVVAAGVRAARSRRVRIGYAVRCVCQCFV